MAVKQCCYWSANHW